MQDLEGPVDMEDDDVAMEPSSGAKRDFLSDLFPFTRPVAFYKGLMEDVGRMQGVGYIIGCTTTAHPALPLACRLMGSDCMMLLDRPAEHSLNHGQVICEEYLLKKALADLPISPVKRRLEVSEVQLLTEGDLMMPIRLRSGSPLVPTLQTSSPASTNGRATCAMNPCRCSSSSWRSTTLPLPIFQVVEKA